MGYSALKLLPFLFALVETFCPLACTCDGTIVKCSGAYLTSIPSGIPVTTTELVISKANIQVVHFTENLPQLQKLRVSICNVSTFDSSKANLPRNLSELDLTANGVTNVLLTSGLETITKLYLDYNNLDRFEAHLFILPNLSHLSLMHNALTNIDFSKGLENLKSLDLTGNMLKRLDSAMLGMPQLESLSFGGNPLEYLNLSTGCQGLKFLQLNRVGISHFDGNLGNLPNLQVLDMRDNKIAELNLGSSFPNLQSLLLNGNLLTSINLTAFPHLQTLNLAYNRLTNTDFLLGLENLQNLGLNNNSFAIFDASTMPLTHLKNLNLQNNHLTSFRLPNAILELELLYLNGNSLTEFDLSYLEKPRIRYLDLSRNQLSLLDISQISGLKTVRLEGNHISRIYFNVSAPAELQILLLGGNPVHCGCCMVHLLRGVQRVTGICAEPHEVAGKVLEDVSPLLNCSDPIDCTNPAFPTASWSSAHTQVPPATEDILSTVETIEPSRPEESSSEFAGIPIHFFVVIIVVGVAFLAVVVAIACIFVRRSRVRKQKESNKERPVSNFYEDVKPDKMASDNLAYEYAADIFAYEFPPDTEEIASVTSHELATFNQMYESSSSLGTFRGKRSGPKPKLSVAVESEDTSAYVGPRSSSYMDLHSKL